MPGDNADHLNPPGNDRPLLIAFWLMLAVALASWGTAWNASLLDSHIFRQTQTAISAHWIKQDGFRLDYETPLFGPPWSVPMEFPVYQWCVAQLSRVSRLPLEQSGRATSALFFLAALPAVYVLAGLARLTTAGRLLVVACALSCPIYLYYGRSFMIETAALCFAIWFLVATALAVRRPSPVWSVIATLCGILAALTKVTTFALYCFPAAALALWLIWPHWKARRESAGWWLALGCGVTPVLIAAGVGEWWVLHADAVKASNPFSHFLQSSEMTAWNWGTLEERLSLVTWQEFWRDLSQCVVGEPALVVFLVCLVSIPAWWRRWAAVGIAGYVLGPLMFSNLYYRHDYYYTANSLFLMISAGMLLAGMWSSSLLPRGVKVMLLTLFFGSQFLTFYRGLAYNYRRELPSPPEIADVIRQTVQPDDVVLIYGWDWNSLIPYYAQRRAIVVPDHRELDAAALDQVLGKLPPRHVTAMLVRRDTFEVPASFVAERATRFGLVPTPFAASLDGELYLPKEVAEQNLKQLTGLKYRFVNFPAAPGASATEGVRRESDLSDVDLAVVSPKASRSSSLFGVSKGNVDQRSILDAHAPADIWISVPRGATYVTAKFGLHEGAYTGRPPFTDGIGVTISELKPGGTPRVIFHRELDPAGKPGDRGTQKMELTNAEPFTGQLLFQFDPGPNGKIDKDWAYWEHIEIR